jgi:hypothetical protein
MAALLDSNRGGANVAYPWAMNTRVIDVTASAVTTTSFAISEHPRHLLRLAGDGQLLRELYRLEIATERSETASHPEAVPTYPAKLLVVGTRSVRATFQAKKSMSS